MENMLKEMEKTLASINMCLKELTALLVAFMDKKSEVK